MPLLGDPIRLRLLVEDGSTGKGVRAFLTDASGSAVAGSPFNLTHESNGLYSNSAVAMPSTAFVKAVYKVFTDGTYATIDTGYGYGLDTFTLGPDTADKIFDNETVESGLTFRNALRVMAASIAGKLSGAATTTVVIRNAVADSKDRITATVDTNGNRSAITYDLS